MNVLRSLCNDCQYRLYVKSHETGVAFDRCQVLKVDIPELGRVRECTRYESRTESYLFDREAWIISKDDEGKLIFKDRDGKVRN